MRAKKKAQKFDVHIFAVVRIKVPGIEARNQHEAIEKALDEQDLYTPFQDLRGVDESDYAEEISHYLVDVCGNRSFNKSRYYRDHYHWQQIQDDPVYRAETHPAEPKKERKK